jgi:putative spermidine/putrescine transport system permease protein
VSEVAATPLARAAHAGRSGRRSAGRWFADWAPALPILAVVTFCLVLPVLALFVRSFVTSEGVGLQLWERVLTQPATQRGIITSIELGLVCATISTVVGTPLAWLVSRMLPTGRAAWLSLFNVAAHFGGIGLAFAYVATLGTFGMLTLFLQGFGLGFEPPNRGSFAALVITYEYANIPLFVLLTVPAMAILRDEWSEAAQTSSATRLQFWRRVGLPVLAPFIAAGFVLSFTWTIGIFGIAYALAGGSAALPIQLITLQIGYALVDDAIRGPERAAVLSVVLLVLALSALFVYRLLLRRGMRWFAGGSVTAEAALARRTQAGRDRAGRTARFLLFGGILAYVIVPISAVLLYSIATRWTSNVLPEGFTLHWWIQTFQDPRILSAIQTSMLLGLFTTVGVLAISVPAVYWMRVRNPRIRPLLDISAAIPFALPFLVIGFALLYFSGTFVPPLQGTFPLVVLAYIAVTFPFVYWALDGSMAAANVKRLTEAAEVSGATAWQTVRRVILPNIKPGLATAAMLSFATAIGEFALIRVLASGIRSVPVWSAEALLDRGGGVAALAVVTFVMFVVLFLISAAVAWVNRERMAAVPGVGR